MQLFCGMKLAKPPSLTKPKAVLFRVTFAFQRGNWSVSENVNVNLISHSFEETMGQQWTLFTVQPAAFLLRWCCVSGGPLRHTLRAMYRRLRVGTTSQKAA